VATEILSPEAVTTQADGPSLWTLLTAAVAIVAAGVLWQSGWARKEVPRPPASAVAGSMPEPAPQPPAPAYSSAALKFMQARQKIASGDASGAFVLFEQALRDEPQNAEFHSGFGQALLQVGRADEAVAEMRQAARLTPSTYQGVLARFLYVAGRTDESLREYEVLIADQPQDVSAAREYATILSQAGQFARAADALRRLTQAQPQNSNLQTELAYALERAGDTRAASDAYRAALSADPANANALARLADLLGAQGEGQQVVDLYRTALERNPTAAPLHRRLGEALEKTGDYRQAALHYREYVRLNPNEPMADGVAKRAAMLEARLAERS